MKYNSDDFIEYGCEDMNIFQRFYYCLFSAKKMAYMRFQSLPKTFLILLMLCVISLAPIYFFTKDAYDDLIQVQIPEMRDKIPAFTVTKGTLQTASGTEEKVTQGVFTLALSPNETSSNLRLDADEFGVELLKNNLVFSWGETSQTVDYSTFMSETFTDKDVKGALDLAVNKSTYFYVLYFAFAFVNSFVFKLLEVTMIAALSFILARTMRKALPFKQIWTISACAIVIPTVFFAVTDSLMISVPFGSFIFSLSTLFVLFQILKEIPQQMDSIS